MRACSLLIDSPQATQSPLHDKAQFPRIAMNQQLDLLIEDDRPERGHGWIVNPSAPATAEDLREFFKEMNELLDGEEGKP